MATKVNQKDLLELLPTNISESQELSIQAKKVLGALLHWALNSQASETRRIIIDNSSLCTIASISKSTLMKALDELKSYSLIERRAGHKREANKENRASEYFIHWTALEQPLKKASFQDRFVKFFEQSSTVDKSSIDKLSLDKISIDKNSEEKINIDKIKLEKENYLLNIPLSEEKEENDMEIIIEILDYIKKLQQVKTVEECKALAREVYEQLLSMGLEEPLLTEVKNRLHQDWVKRLNELQSYTPTVVEGNPLTAENVMARLDLIPRIEATNSLEELKTVVAESIDALTGMNLTIEMENEIRTFLRTNLLPKQVKKFEDERLENLATKMFNKYFSNRYSTPVQVTADFEEFCEYRINNENLTTAEKEKVKKLLLPMVQALTARITMHVAS